MSPLLVGLPQMFRFQRGALRSTTERARAVYPSVVS